MPDRFSRKEAIGHAVLIIWREVGKEEIPSGPFGSKGVPALEKERKRTSSFLTSPAHHLFVSDFIAVRNAGEVREAFPPRGAEPEKKERVQKNDVR